MQVFVRVKATNKAGKFLSSRDAAPFVELVGRVGNTWVERELAEEQIAKLTSSGIFEVRLDDPRPGRTTRFGRVITLERECDGVVSFNNPAPRSGARTATASVRR